MDATSPTQIQITTTPLVAIDTQPADLSTDSGRLWLVEQGCWLAQQVGNRGEIDQARALMSRNTIPQAQKITDPVSSGLAYSYINVVLTYLTGIAPQAPALVTQAGISDQSYVNAQVLSAGQLLDAQNDNADTAAMLAGTLSPSAYEYGIYGPAAEQAANTTVQTVEAVSGAVKNVANGGLTTYLVIGGVILLSVLGAMLYLGMKATSGKTVTVST